MSHFTVDRSLAAVRRRLTIWYLATFVLVLALLGGGLFLAIRHQIRSELDLSLRRATIELERAAGIRQQEIGAAGLVVDAVDELRIPGRSLYLFDGSGNLLRPDSADAWIKAAARQAIGQGSADLTRELPDERNLRIHAERFTLPNGTPQVAVVVADQVELEQRYASLIASFGAAALAALLLVGAAAALMVNRSTAPVEDNITQMRRFMADAAHELRTPVAVLRTRVDVALQRPRDASSYQETLQFVELESRRLSGLVDDLLTLARADAGERPVHRENCFLDDLALDACSAARALAAARDMTLDITQFDEAEVHGDSILLRRLMMILLDNAIKFTPAGGAVTVSTGVSGDEATFTVSDNGPGIAPEERELVFERFHRGRAASGDAARSVPGTGLGLSIARWIATIHGGTLTLEEPDAPGTRVRLSLPRVRPTIG